MPAYNGDVIRVRAIGTTDGQLWNNVMHFTPDGGPVDIVALQQLAGLVSAWYEAYIAPLVATSWALNAVEATAMDAPPALQYLRSEPFPIAGTLGGEALPNNVSACLSLKAGTTGKSGRGRIYLCGFPETSTVRSRFTVGVVTSLNVAGLALLQNAPGDALANFTIGIYSQFFNSALRATGLFTPAVSVGMADDVVDSQRRRLPGRGA